MNTAEDNNLLEAVCTTVFGLVTYRRQTGGMDGPWDPQPPYYNRERFGLTKTAGLVEDDAEAFFIGWDGVWEDPHIVRVEDGRLLKLVFEYVAKRWKDCGSGLEWEVFQDQDGDQWNAAIRRFSDGVREVHTSGPSVNHAVFQAAVNWTRRLDRAQESS